MSVVVSTMHSHDMRSTSEHEEVDRWIRFGQGDSAITSLTHVPRGTVRDWRGKGPELRAEPDCPQCGGSSPEPVTYAYLLGLYLGDGCISLHRRDVYRLRIVMDQRYPSILTECADAIRAIRPSTSMRVGRVQRVGCLEINAYWKHWPCLFPQHGPGRKHLRPIILTQWQRNIVRLEPARLLRGLIQSDGCRVLNSVNGRRYPRYLFTNESAEIRGIFCQACSGYGVVWRRMNRKTISIARAADVAKLDMVIGPKA